jgi:pimeloyl-ACP methyl ester carboxylesterase
MRRMAVRSTFIVCTRDIRRTKFGTEPGPCTFLRVPRDAEDYAPSNAMSPERWKTAVIAAADGEEDEITGCRGEILFFVHGYNNDIETVLWRTRMLQKTLADAGWRGLVVGFDWPSDNATLNYIEDRQDASAVSARLVEHALSLLIDAQFPERHEDACRINVHLLGHSTGAYVIMDGFANAAKRGDFFRKPWRIGQVAFIAGDVSRDSLAADSDWAAPMFGRIFRLTNYSNGYDKVLAVSNMKRLGTSPRAGRVGVAPNAPRCVVNVDCSEYFLRKEPATSVFQGTFNHSWHIGDPVFATDLAMTLEGGIDREHLPTRRHAQSGLVLVPGVRPAHQVHWDAERPPGP